MEQSLHPHQMFQTTWSQLCGSIMAGWGAWGFGGRGAWWGRNEPICWRCGAWQEQGWDCGAWHEQAWNLNDQGRVRRWGRAGNQDWRNYHWDERGYVWRWVGLGDGGGAVGDGGAWIPPEVLAAAPVASPRLRLDQSDPILVEAKAKASCHCPPSRLSTRAKTCLGPSWLQQRHVSWLRAANKHATSLN